MMTGLSRTQVVIGSALALLMAATRGHHFGTLEHLPSASWAVFFLAGFSLSSRWVFPALLAEAALLDFAAITWGGVDGFCVSPAYGFLVPAYGVLWGAGRWYAARHQEKIVTLLPLAGSLVLGTALCEVISSGGFYFFSGRFEVTSLEQFVPRIGAYYPGAFSSVLFYVAIAGAIHTLLRLFGALTARMTRVRISS